MNTNKTPNKEQSVLLKKEISAAIDYALKKLGDDYKRLDFFNLKVIKHGHK